MTFDTIDRAIEHFRTGGMLLVVDNEDRENECDLIVAATHATPATITLMARYGCGLICLVLEESRADMLGLSPMVPHDDNRSTSGNDCSFTRNDFGPTCAPRPKR